MNTFKRYTGKFEGSIQQASPGRTSISAMVSGWDVLKTGKFLLEARLFRLLQQSGEDSAIVSLRLPAYRLSRVSPSIQRQAGPVGTASAAMGFFSGVAPPRNSNTGITRRGGRFL